MITPVTNTHDAATIATLPVDLIDTEPQIRTRNGFDAASIGELAASIREHGLMQPIMVTPVADRYTVLAGHRRLAAVRHLRGDTIAAIVADVSEIRRLELQLVENIQREQLDTLDTAAAVRQLLDNTKAPAVVAKVLGKSKSWVSKYAALTSPSFSGRALALMKDGFTDDLELVHTIHQINKLSEGAASRACESVQAGAMTRAMAAAILRELKAATDENTEPGDPDTAAAGESADPDVSPEKLPKLELAEKPARLLLKAVQFANKSKPSSRPGEALEAHLQAFIEKHWPAN